jgi:hypothetical protein
MQLILAHIEASLPRTPRQSLSEWALAFLTILPVAHQKSARWAALSTENPLEQVSISWYGTYAVLELEGNCPLTVAADHVSGRFHASQP